MLVTVVTFSDVDDTGFALSGFSMAAIIPNKNPDGNIYVPAGNIDNLIRTLLVPFALIIIGKLGSQSP